MSGPAHVVQLLEKGIDMRVAVRMSIVTVVALVASLATAGAALAVYPVGGGIECSASTVEAGESNTCASPGFDAECVVQVVATGPTTGSGDWVFEGATIVDASGEAVQVIETPTDAVGVVAVTFTGQGACGDREFTNPSAFTVTQPAGEDTGVASGAVGGANGGADGTGGETAGVAADNLGRTGIDASTGILAVIALMVVGGSLLVLSRRRTRERIET